MDKNTLQLLLTSLQFLSIILSGVLGMFGLMFNYKDKESGKLTRGGKTAFLLLFVSLCLGLTSKIVEQNIKRKAEESEATRARIAAEQSLRVSRNVERVVNAIQTISVDLDLEVAFDSPVFEQFNGEIKNRIGESWDDRNYSPEELAGKIPNNQWKQLIRDLTFVNPILKIYPKGSPIPKCINEEKHAPLELGIPFSVDNIEIPQQESRLRIDYNGNIYIQRRDSSQILSLLDFKGATLVGYIFLATKEEIPSIDTTVSTKNVALFEKRFPAASWKLNTITFSFDHGRSIHINSFEIKHDKCTGQSIFVSQIAD